MPRSPRCIEDRFCGRDSNWRRHSAGWSALLGSAHQVPDVLVLEPHMPWGGGDGILAVMGECPDLARVPVMILTACRDPHVLNGVDPFPISDYHVKPLAPDRLAVRLRSLLDHPRLRFTLAEQTGRLGWSDRAGSPAAASGPCRWQPWTGESSCGAAPTRTTSSSKLALAAVLEAFEASESQSDRIELAIEVA